MTLARTTHDGTARASGALFAVVLAIGLSLFGGPAAPHDDRTSHRVAADLLRLEAPFAGIPAIGWAGAAPALESGPRAGVRVDLQDAGSHRGMRGRQGDHLPWGTPPAARSATAHARTPRGSMLFGLPAVPANAPPHRS